MTSRSPGRSAGDGQLTRRPEPGTVSWLDLSSADVDAVTEFYAALLGWSYQSIDTPFGRYHVAQLADRDVAGIMAAHPREPGGSAWTVFVEVASADDVADRASAAGGAVLQPPMDVPGGGRIAMLVDPAGAMLGVIESSSEAEVLPRGVPGALFWVEVLSRDAAAAERFYSALFGWKPVTGPTGYTAFLLDDVPVAGLMAMPPQVPAQAPSHWLVSFMVADLDRAIETAVRSGAVLDQPLVELEDGRFAVLDDPGGATVALFARRSPSPRS
jgi:predicted enzyme related to lactoylglutathione lyase